MKDLYEVGLLMSKDMVSILGLILLIKIKLIDNILTIMAFFLIYKEKNSIFINYEKLKITFHIDHIYDLLF